jgi:hypothetical protein
MSTNGDHAQVYGDVHNPAEVEVKIEETKDRIHAGVKIVTNAERKAKAARTEFDFEFALAMGRATGPAINQKYQATVDTIEFRKIAEGLEITFKHAVRTAEALERELYAWLSILNSVRAMYNVVGTR